MGDRDKEQDKLKDKDQTKLKDKDQDKLQDRDQDQDKDKDKDKGKDKDKDKARRGDHTDPYQLRYVWTSQRQTASWGLRSLSDGRQLVAKILQHACNDRSLPSDKTTVSGVLVGVLVALWEIAPCSGQQRY